MDCCFVLRPTKIAILRPPQDTETRNPPARGEIIIVRAGQLASGRWELFREWFSDIYREENPENREKFKVRGPAKDPK